MVTLQKRWARVPSGVAVPNKDSSMGKGETRGAKNHWVNKSCTISIT